MRLRRRKRDREPEVLLDAASSPDRHAWTGAELALIDLLVMPEHGSELKHQQCFDNLTDDELTHYVVRLGELHGRAHVELERRQR